MAINYPLFILLLICGLCSAVEPYRVLFVGVEDPELLALLCSSSQLVSLEDTSGVTAAALRRRADSDLPRLLKVLHNFAYYNAKIHFTLDFDQSPVLVTVAIDLGPVYPFAEFNIFPEELRNLTLPILDIQLGMPAIPEKILNAEEDLLFLLAKQGNPYASIVKREVLVDQRIKAVIVNLYVNPGPVMRLGATTIEGNCSVKEAFFQKKIAWMKGSPFNPVTILETQNALEESRLFRIVSITYPDQIPYGEDIPMKISVVEGKHRSVGAGLSYSTQLGPGVEADWENRNVRGMGETLHVKTTIAGRLQIASLQYIQPDFWFRHQDFIWSADWQHEVTREYKETAYSLSGIIQHRLGPFATVSYGGTFMELKNSGSDRNGSFHLLKTPIVLRWNNIDNILDPGRGSSFYGRIVPTAQVIHPKFVYIINQMTATYYKTFSCLPRLVFASKLILGTILGTSREEIPPSERFYAGSETTLRGYRYMTVIPSGGRSIVIGTLELRWRVSESLGVVYFYDVGNVYRNSWPQFNKELLNSLGVGVRYYTSVGPIRLDVAFPINPRHGIDSSYQFYFSIGQAF